MIKLMPGKGSEWWRRSTIVPVEKEMEEERTLVPTFTKQLSDNGLYKIWPQDPLPQGEYAVVEYTEGKVQHSGLGLQDSIINHKTLRESY